jgi:hypothetical protein
MAAPDGSNRQGPEAPGGHSPGRGVKWATMTASVISALALAACGTQAVGSAGGIAGVLAHLRPLEKTCHGPLNGFFDDDISGSGRGSQPLADARLSELRDLTNRVAACDGDMQANAFSSSAADSITLGEAAFPQTSGTDTARLIGANNAANRFLETVEGSLTTAMREVSPAGTDVLSQLVLAKQFQAQHESGTLEAEIVTDGIATAGPVYMETPKFTVLVAEADARRVEVPDLAGARVRIVGIGRSAGLGFGHLPAERIAAMTRFYEIACQRTGAAGCLVTTDYSHGGA